MDRSPLRPSLSKADQKWAVITRSSSSLILMISIKFLITSSSPRLSVSEVENLGSERFLRCVRIRRPRSSWAFITGFKLCFILALQKMMTRFLYVACQIRIPDFFQRVPHDRVPHGSVSLHFLTNAICLVGTRPRRAKQPPLSVSPGDLRFQLPRLWLRLPQLVLDFHLQVLWEFKGL